VLHAESNAIVKVAKSTSSSDGATMYTTLSPCDECSKLIVQAGIKRIVFDEVYEGSIKGLDLLKMNNIQVEQIIE
jgi:dCMP deaminase